MKPRLFSYPKIILYFLTAVLLTVLVLPRERQFQYDYSKGKPWMYKTLEAPFDFPIYKSADELAENKKEVQQRHKPYFRVNKSIGQQELKALSDFINTANDAELNQSKQYLLSALSFVYEKGIWQTSDLKSEFSDRQMLVVAIIDNNVSEDCLASQLFTISSAYEYISHTLQESIGSAQAKDVLKHVNIRQYLKVNLSYDDNTTQQVLQNELANIPLTKGVVTAGTKVVEKGEVVGPVAFQLLESLRKEYEEQYGYPGSFWLLVAGQVLFVSLCYLGLFVLLYVFRPDIIMRSSSSIFILLLVVLFVYLSMLTLRSDLNVFIVPIVAIPIYISTFFYARPALFVHWITILLIAFYVPNSFEYIFISFMAGIASIISFRTIYRRGRLFVAVGTILSAYILSYFAILLIQEGSLSNLSVRALLDFVINILLLLTAYQLVYVFEKVFGFLSNTTLMELSDTNRKLLRKLAELTPGTFQHSMQVANLAEEVIREIGGNPLLVRCGALYHDIGKMENPAFFIENKAGGFNPHEGLPPEKSAEIIIKHVEDGVHLAKKYNLPAPVIDFIKTHHATSKTQYFYVKYKEANPDATDFSQFFYPGPPPSTKETAVVMMADSIEAASRSLTTITQEAIDALVEKIVDLKVESGFFSNVPITFKELIKAKEVFKKKLGNIYHARIEYPEMK